MRIGGARAIPNFVVDVLTTHTGLRDWRYPSEARIMSSLNPLESPNATLALGRYRLFDEIASGGMASVHFGRLSGPSGFSRVVAIKRLHPNFARDPEFVTMFLEEARLAARIRHLNVVSTLDVVASDGEVFLVMDYVHGQSLASLWRAMRAQKRLTDPHIVAAVMSGVCRGLHAAHEARGQRGEALRIVHRDISPQNILVGVDGVARVLDFGVAKASGRTQTTSSGRIKGKLAYMPPEQLHGATVTRRTDVYAAGVVTWELLTGQRAFGRPSDAAVVAAVLEDTLLPPSQVAPHVPAAFDAVVMRALDRNPHRRHATAQELAIDLERCVGVASMSDVGAWVCQGGHEELGRRAHRMAVIDGGAQSQASLPRSPVASDGSDIPTRPTDGAPVVEPPEVSAVSRVAMSRAGRNALADLVNRVGVAKVANLGARARRIARVVARDQRLVVVASAAIVVLVVLALSVRVLLGGGPRLAPEPTAASSRSATPAHEGLVVSPLAVLPALAALDPPAIPGPSPAGASAPRATPAPRPASARPQARPKRECDPPFTIESNGHKRYKAACLD
jgi:eukaryotic-like serine/threonine-protein kinase